MAYGKFNILIYPDENLAKIIGKDPQPPTVMVSNLWKYIKKNNLSKKA